MEEGGGGLIEEGQEEEEEDGGGGGRSSRAWSSGGKGVASFPHSLGTRLERERHELQIVITTTRSSSMLQSTTHRCRPMQPVQPYYMDSVCRPHLMKLS